MTYPKQSKGIRLTLLLLFLSLFTTACARNSVAPSNDRVPAVACVHPVVDLSTRAGTYEALAAYYTALETCNALNGVGDATVLVPQANGPDVIVGRSGKTVAVPVPDKQHGRIYKLFHRDAGASVPSPAVIPGKTTVIVPAPKP